MSNKTKNVMLITELPDGTEQPKAVVVKRIKVRQINRAFSAVSAILDGFSANPELEQMVYDAFLGADEFDPGLYPDATEAELKLIKAEYENKNQTDMAMSVLKSSGFLLVKLPEQMAELVSAMSNIDRELLLDQEPDVFADVVEAVLEVNEFNVLWERAKQVFGETVAAFRFKETKAKTEAKTGNQAAKHVLQ